MSWRLAWKVWNDWMGRASDLRKLRAIRHTLNEVPGVIRVHDLRLRRMDGSRRDDMTVADARIAIDASLGAEAAQDIAVIARQRVLQRHRVLNMLIDVDSQD